MRNRLLSCVMAVWLCILTMTSCLAAEVPPTGSSGPAGQLTSDFVRTSAFSDVPADAWYADAVAYCQQNGIMSGTTATTFAPEATLTRAMLAAVLHRMSNTPCVRSSCFHGCRCRVLVQ